MKKIGILFGQERSFPEAVIQRINEKEGTNFFAEPVLIDKVIQSEGPGYAAIIDRISHNVPFYRGFLKNAALAGTAVMNNPFWWSADEKFFNNALAIRLGVPVPRTVLLPSNQMPPDTTAKSFSNLKFPLDWEGIFEYVGFPAYFKPFDGGGWKNVYKLEDMEQYFNAYSETEQFVMMLQEEVVFEEYYRCYSIGGKDVRIMQYEPRNPSHLRYVLDGGKQSKKLMATIKDYVLRLNKGLGYDINTVEFAVRNGVPLAIDFCNPAPDADLPSVGQENFEWVVEAVAKMAIARAKMYKPGKPNLTWGDFTKQATLNMSVINPDADDAAKG